MRIERIRESHIYTDSEVWGLDQTTYELMWTGEAAMRKSIHTLRPAAFESIADVPSVQKSCRKTSFVVVPSVMKICATSHGKQEVYCVHSCSARTARCVSRKGQIFVVYRKVTVFCACGFREFVKTLTEMLVGWFGRRL